MSESSVVVTPGSGGPDIDLELVDNGNARQVVCIGDASTGSKVAPVDATLGVSVNVTNASLPLGANAAKETGGNLDSIKSDLDTIKTNTTQLNTTQPVSAASLPLPSGAATSANQTNGSATTQLVDSSGHNLNIDPSGTARVNIVTPTTLPSKPGDVAANRTRIVLSADAIASVTSEAMMTFQSYKAGVVTTGLTSYTVTAGKTFKVQSIKVKIRPATPSTTVTFASTTLRLREGSLITSPLIDSFPILMQTNNDSNPMALGISDGLEFPSGTVLGMSHVASATTILEQFSIIGYEY